MRKYKIVLIGFAVVIAAAAVYLFASSGKLGRDGNGAAGEAPVAEVPKEIKTIDQTLPAPGLEKQENSEGGITVAAEPFKENSAWNFEIVLDTHSVDLAYDMVEVSELAAGGKTFKPVAWDGDPPGGHHRSGILKFGNGMENEKSITLKISEIGGVDRIFEWEMK